MHPALPNPGRGVLQSAGAALTGHPQGSGQVAIVQGKIMKTGNVASAYPRLWYWAVLLPLLLLGMRGTAFAQTDLTIYDEALAPGWQNWSWATVDTASMAEAHSGSVSIAVTPAAWSALYLRSADAPLDTNGYLNFTFWVHGGATGGQTIQVVAVVNDLPQPGVRVTSPTAGSWQKITVPLAALGADNRTDVNGFWVQQGSGVDDPTFYVDTIVLESGTPPTPPPPVNGMAIYQDSLVNGWNNWSWASVNTASTATVHTGSSAIAVTADAFEALYLQHAAMPTDAFESLKFWIHGGATGGQTLNVVALRAGTGQPAVLIGPLAPEWTEVVIPLAQLGIANVADLDGLWLQDNSGVTQPTFYVDDIHLEFAPPPGVVNVTVNPKQRIRKVDRRMFGINAAVWDGAYASPNTQALLTELDNQALRFPGGSLSDVYHWQTNMSEGQTFEWATSYDEFIQIAAATRAATYITVNYGTGTPEEAAAWVRHANKVKRNNVRYWEVGNENYGTWEADNNTRPHDPVTYATRFKEYWRQMKAVDPSIKIGAVIALGEDAFANYPEQQVTNPRTGEVHSGWTPVMLDTLRQLGVTPDFVVYHRYEQGPGGESDLFLLNSASSWANDAAAIRQMLDDYLGTKARKVELACTEHNSVFSNPGKQTTSLVNGLFYADAIGNLLKTEFNAMLWWDLRNGQEAGNNNSASLYGWRRYGDYGIVNAADPAGPADRYPTFYVNKLLKHFARGGEKVVEAGSDYRSLGVYAVRGEDRSLRILVINKHPSAALNATLAIPALKRFEKAKVFSYGIPQDEAARTGEGSADVQESTLTLSGPTLTFSPGPYSVHVIQLGPRDKDDESDAWGDLEE
jgi:alpha-N-arabinofuranosidase